MAATSMLTLGLADTTGMSELEKALVCLASKDLNSKGCDYVKEMHDYNVSKGGTGLSYDCEKTN